MSIAIKILRWLGIYCFIFIQYLSAINAPLLDSKHLGPNDLLNVAVRAQSSFADFPFPPSNLAGKQKIHPFKESVVNIITWDPPSCGSPPIRYEIYRNSSLTKLLATVPANGELKFKNKMKIRNSDRSYFIVSIDAIGRRSFASGISFENSKVQVLPLSFIFALSITPSDDRNIAIGEHLQLRAHALLSDCSIQHVTNQVDWISSDTSVAHVDSRGNVLGINEGSTKITARLGRDSITIPLNVVAGPTPGPVALESIEITPTDPQYIEKTSSSSGFIAHAIGHYSDGNSQDISLEVDWHTENPIVSFRPTPRGELVQAVAAGTTSVTASLGPIISKNAIPVTVAPIVVTELIIIPSGTFLNPGQKIGYTVFAVYSDNSMANVTDQATFLSSDSAVVSVEGNTATAIEVGFANITAKFQGFSATSPATVFNPN